MIRKIFSLFLLGNFILSSVIPNSAYAQTLTLPTPGTMLATSEAYVPLIFKGLQVKPENPMLFDFIVDTGDTGFKVGKDDTTIRMESQKLIKYFLASLTLPEQDQWVNLSPYEQNRMMPAELEKTELGRDMLAQDYVLKQVTASLIYPENDLGKQFWSKVYARVQERFGNAEIPIDTFNKVWVVADKADVYVNNNTAFVVGSHLKVMLESDYLAAQKSDTPTATDIQEYTKQIVREIVLPALENEVNTGKNFANLRQIFHAMILATWYKKNLKEALLNQVYSNKVKTNGVTLGATNLNPQTIYSKYVEAYKKGAFNLIKEDVLANGETVPRKYFSGGAAPNLGAAKALQIVDINAPGVRDFAMGSAVRVHAGLQNVDSAMLDTVPGPGEEFLKELINKVAALTEIANPLERSYTFLGNEGVLSEKERREKGTLTSTRGTTEVAFLSDCPARRRMVDFLKEVKNLLGKKILLVGEGPIASDKFNADKFNPDLIHLTTQNLEYAVDGTPIGFHEGTKSLEDSISIPSDIKFLVQRAQEIPFHGLHMKVISLENHAPAGIIWVLRPYASSLEEDPIRQRRKQWSDTTSVVPRLGFPPYHMSGFYIIQPLSANELTELRAIQARYNESEWGDVYLNKVDVIAYNDASFNSGIKVLTTIVASKQSQDANQSTVNTGREDVAAHFDAFWAEHQSKKPEEIAIDMVRNGEILKGMDVLSLGAGVGHNEIFFAQSGARVVAVDVAKSAVDIINQKASELALTDNLNATEHDFTQPFDFLDQMKVDVIFAHQSLMYFTDSQMNAILNNIFESLKPGGKTIITVRSTEDYKFKNNSRKTGLNTAIGPEDSVERRFFTEDELSEFLTRAGFQDIKIAATRMRMEGRPLVSSVYTVTASKGANAQLPPGGIDMNAQKMTMNEKGQKVNMTFDPAMAAQFKRGDFTGLKPVIFNITPIVNPSLLLGLNQEESSHNS